MVDIGLGNHCNSNCFMCTAIVPPPPAYQAPTTEAVLNTIREHQNESSFTITGGEPTIRKDLFMILEEINNINPDAKINLISNGRMFSYEAFVKQFDKIKNIRFITELHGATAELHDAITRSEGSFDQTCAGIKNLIAHDNQVEFRIVISKMNYQNIPDIAAFAASEFPGIHHITMFPIDIIGNAFINKDDLIVTYRELIPYVEEAASILSDAGIKVILYHIPFCTIKDRFHKFIKKGITVLERRVDFSEICTGCRFEDVCPRVWKTYIHNVGTDEFKKIM